MTALLDYLRKNTITNVAILAFYYALVVLPHEIVGKWIAKQFDGVTRGEYDKIILVLFLIITLAVFISLYDKIHKHKRKNLLYLLGLISTVLIVFCFNFLFVVNVEAIHFVQYAMLAILSFPVIQNYTQTMVFSTLAGMLDEAYQYFVLAPLHTEYYDFNDVIINQIGAGIGLIIVSLYSSTLRKEPFYKSKIAYLVYAIVLIFSLLFLLGVFSYYASDESVFSLIRVKQDGFWSVVHPSIIFHVIRPLEGLILMVLLILLYGRLDKNQD